jgi:predicted metal-dependent hydrolase
LTLFVAVRLINKQERQRQDIGSTTEASGGSSTQNSAGRPRLWPLLKELLSLPLYLDYYRPSFHPWDHDNRHLIAEWKKRYRTFGAGPDGHLHDAEEGADAVTAS